MSCVLVFVCPKRMISIGIYQSMVERMVILHLRNPIWFVIWDLEH